ncbi:MAG: hypothetical protein PUD59_03415 [bacterium]|nr:hypothetical protein [bacterium]
MKKYKYIIRVIIITVIINLIFIPIKLNSSIKTYYGIDNIINIMKTKKCSNCFPVSINYYMFIFQIIITFIITYIIMNRRRKYE